MVKKFSIPCTFKAEKIPVTFYVGNPSDEAHPIHFQSKWLSEKKGGVVSKEVMDSFTELHKISIKNRVPFEDLCAFVMDEIDNTKASISESRRVDRNLPAIKNKMKTS